MESIPSDSSPIPSHKHSHSEMERDALEMEADILKSEKEWPSGFLTPRRLSQGAESEEGQGDGGDNSDNGIENQEQHTPEVGGPST